MGKILVTGATGYIGSHTVVELVNSGHEVVLVDNYSNSGPEAFDRLQHLLQRNLFFYQIDVRSSALRVVFQEHEIDGVIHFAGLKSVEESVRLPLKYYSENLNSLLNLLTIMAEFSCRRFVFSSSATVYGETSEPPHKETSPLSCINPYGYTKLMGEHIIADFCKANPDFKAIALRYFNPIGAHESGLIGEQMQASPPNLLPYVLAVASGKQPYVRVFGSDYPTPDGTGVRDYIHVSDLAQGHVLALDYLQSHQGFFAFNLGTGEGYSVLAIIQAMELACGHEIPYRFYPKRPGDVASSYASPDLARKELGFVAKRNLATMCRDAWRWQTYYNTLEQ